MRTLDSTIYFSSNPSANIDSEKGIIKNVLLARVGEVKGHGLFADEEFTESIVADGVQYSQGVKARFGHPNMSSTTLGTFIGRFHNFKHEGGNAFADLHLDEVAKESPKGDLYSYVLKMAETNPDQFGNSIVFRPAKDELVELDIEVGEVNFDHDTVIEELEDGKVKVERRMARLKKLMASDLVDEGAATDNLFNEDDFAAQATAFLDSNPKILDLVEKNPEVLDGFMAKYNKYKNRKSKTHIRMSDSKESLSLSEKLDAFMKQFSAKEATPEAVVEPVVEEPSVDVEALSTKFDEMQTAFAAKMAEKEAELNALKSENEQLSVTPTEALGNEGAPVEEAKPECSKFSGTPFARSMADRLEQKFNINFNK